MGGGWGRGGECRGWQPLMTASPLGLRMPASNGAGVGAGAPASVINPAHITHTRYEYTVHNISKHYEYAVLVQYECTFSAYCNMYIALQFVMYSVAIEIILFLSLDVVWVI